MTAELRRSVDIAARLASLLVVYRSHEIVAVVEAHAERLVESHALGVEHGVGPRECDVLVLERRLSLEVLYGARRSLVGSLQFDVHERELSVVGRRRSDMESEEGVAALLSHDAHGSRYVLRIGAHGLLAQHGSHRRSLCSLAHSHGEVVVVEGALTLHGVGEEVVLTLNQAHSR